MRTDICIIGAGAEGLACAAITAAAGLKTLVLERLPQPGGRCVTRAFAPGHFASPFCDTVPAIPDDLFRRFDLARRGVAADGISLGPDRFAALRQAAIAHGLDQAGRVPRLFGGKMLPWPGEALARAPYADFGTVPDLPLPCDPALPGSALVHLAPPAFLLAGGPGRLTTALLAAAEEAGAEIRLEADVTDIRRRFGAVTGVGLADGSEIAARAVVSTLDVKRTVLSLFAWDSLPKAMVERAGRFRAAPGIARLLLALKAPQSADPALLRRPIALPAAPVEAYRGWASAIIPSHPPGFVRVLSAVDPFAAPDGEATLTVTLGAIPHTPFDGPWDAGKRAALREAALDGVEAVLPGTRANVKAAVLLLPPDIENELGLTEGDLSGGEYSASQMLSFRPFPDCMAARTPLKRLYLAGPSSALGPLGTCASGAAAAAAVLADLRVRP